ncbi:glycosyltransferase [Halovenus sp. WSH3]|uniref:Glycosyltransferase n=1 Tax=Halovenus carboxidivorans TaxID=2692199 RepID=A0A6B0T5Z7_9EURY|nr:glycosyltransferase [Halovenus carboxidivorans]MXR50993.1 glycosyltransferase [Halovenus carboxidivorans]
MSETESITVFLPGLHGGGAEKMMLDLSSEFVDRGLDVDLVVASREGKFLDKVPEKVDLIDLDAPEPPGYGLLGALPGLISHLRDRCPDAVLSALNRANIVAVLATRLSQVDARVVVSERNHLSTYLDHAMRREQLALPRLIRAVYPYADDVVAISEGVADDLAETAGLDRESITVVYNPAMTPEIRGMYDEPVEYPWFGDDLPVIIGVGSLTEQKDFPTLLRAVAHLREERPCRLVICGEGEKRPELEALVEELGLDDIVDLPGFVDNPYAMMNQADVFALSSKWEGFGNVIVEALGCGCPVVSTDCPSGPAEILSGGKHGELVPVGDPRALASGIAAQLDDPPNARELQERADDFAVDTIAREYLTVLLDR